MDGTGSINTVVFGRWRYSRFPGQLFRRDQAGNWAPVSLGSRAACILAALLRKPGLLVSKDDLMTAAWPGTAVEANNLSVQIASLRRVLDEGVAGPSCIQTVQARGYRLICQVEEAGDPTIAADPAAELLPLDLPPDTPIASVPARAWAWRRHRTALVGVVLLLALLATAVYVLCFGGRPQLPRMSAVVLPFANLGDPEDDKLAAALTEDLKAGLSMMSAVLVVNGRAPRSVNDRKDPVQAIGRRLGARYVIIGSEQRLAGTLRVNAQIVSTETGLVLWTDRLDIAMSDSVSGPEESGARLQGGIVQQLIQIESARSQRERPDNPDGFDLFLRAASLAQQPPTPSRSTEIRALHERALLLDPSSDMFRLGLVNAMLSEEDQNPHGRKAVFERTASLLAAAQANWPQHWWFVANKLYWLYWQENRRCPEVADLAIQFLKRYPVASYYGNAAERWLAACQIVLGHADTAVAVMDRALLFEGHPYRSRDYRNLQFGLLLLGRYDESIRAGQRALAQNPDDVGYERARLDRRLAAAFALSDRLEDARRRLADADHIQPFWTLRALVVGENASQVYAAQIGKVREGLRLAGARDHADEDADFGVPAGDWLHQEHSGPTPRDAPGTTTIHTDALVHLLGDRHPIVIDALNNFAGLSIPGAVGLRYVGDGGALTDMAQDRLRTKMRDLTKGDLDTPLISVGWNSESFDGRNLALRLVALGYTHVSWYRGGREAWEVRGLSETNLTTQDW